ncbi:lysozyme inhibitor LprI family protein [Burkholderia ubonensis]|uniref:lysozyme inhibitor LprI family protein n=1 Tax=Burkholderia ubonensis TaxID=101571 RepID=UPI001582E05B|nr:hypothetical protein [Burkholderia ubonensis]
MIRQNQGVFRFGGMKGMSEKPSLLACISMNSMLCFAYEGGRGTTSYAALCAMPVANYLRLSMMRVVFRLMLAIGLLFHVLGAAAESTYRLTGVARIYSVGSMVQPNLELPINPAESSVLALRGDSFYLNYDGSNPGWCGVKIKKQEPFSFDSAPLGNAHKLNKFLEDKFHINSNGWTTMYLLQDATSPSCTALRFARIYASNSELVLLDGSFIYVFALEKHPFRDASKGFDCGAAKSDVEHLICGDPRLRKMDADVNYGFVLMQQKYSREISYQDPIRIDQIKWVSGVRNKCATVDCLLRAYSSRISHIKGKVSDSSPSYPDDEND